MLNYTNTLYVERNIEFLPNGKDVDKYTYQNNNVIVIDEALEWQEIANTLIEACTCYNGSKQRENIRYVVLKSPVSVHIIDVITKTENII